MRYKAASAAACAAADGGPWREQAIRRLRADLAAWEAIARDGTPEARAGLRSSLARWRRDPALASLRDERALWKGVDALLR